MSKLTKVQIKERRRFFDGQSVRFGNEQGIIGSAFSKDGAICYAILIRRVGRTVGNEYEAVEHVMEREILKLK